MSMKKKKNNREQFENKINQYEHNTNCWLHISYNVTVLINLN